MSQKILQLPPQFPVTRGHFTIVRHEPSVGRGSDWHQSPLKFTEKRAIETLGQPRDTHAFLPDEPLRRRVETAASRFSSPQERPAP